MHVPQLLLSVSLLNPSSVCPLQLSSWLLHVSFAGIFELHVPYALFDWHVCVPVHVPYALFAVHCLVAPVVQYPEG